MKQFERDAKESDNGIGILCICYTIKEGKRSLFFLGGTSSHGREKAQLFVERFITTGGTGLSPRDVTPEVTEALLDKTLLGVSERLRSHGQERNRFAMMSRGAAGVRGKTVIVNLPGSRNAVNESMDVLFPWLLHAFVMMRGEEHKINFSPPRFLL